MLVAWSPALSCWLKVTETSLLEQSPLLRGLKQTPGLPENQRFKLFAVLLSLARPPKAISPAARSTEATTDNFSAFSSFPSLDSALGTLSKAEVSLSSLSLCPVHAHQEKKKKEYKVSF